MIYEMRTYDLKPRSGPAAGGTGYTAVEQETKILLAVPFSPLQ